MAKQLFTYTGCFEQFVDCTNNRISKKNRRIFYHSLFDLNLFHLFEKPIKCYPLALQVDQSVNLLDSLSAASRCDAINFLLQTLKCKYPDACDRVVRSLFSHKPNDNDNQDELAKCKQRQLLLATTTTPKKEKLEKLEPGSEKLSVSVAEIKRETGDEAAASAIDLNQNFEKILCKEEFTCLDEEDDFLDDDADTENSSSMSKRLHFHRSSSSNSSTAKANASRSRINNNADTAIANAVGDATTTLLNSDPLDLIQTAAAASGLIKRKYAASFDDDEELDDDEDDPDAMADGDDDSNSNSCEELLLLRRKQKLIRAGCSELLVKRKRTNNFIGSLDAVAVTPVTRLSSLGDGYVFHEDNQYTLRYHHSSGEFSERAFKAQFRLLLRLALSQHHKPFLKQFYDNFVVTGRLLGTTPSTRVLKELREQRLDEWRRQCERKQLAKIAAEEAAAVAAAGAAARLELERQLLKEKEQQQQREQQQQQQQEEELRQHEEQQLELSEPMDQQLEVPMPLESQEPRQLRSISFGDSELESETESQLSSTAQGIMKFEEFIDEGLGAGRLIDGLEMEPEIDEMLAGAGSGLGSVTGTGSGNSNSNSSAVHDNGIASLLLQDSSHHL